MDTGSELTSDTAKGVCACAVPIPEVRATYKGAARTYCARCGLPMKLDFGAR